MPYAPPAPYGPPAMPYSPPYAEPAYVAPPPPAPMPMPAMQMAPQMFVPPVIPGGDGGEVTVAEDEGVFSIKKKKLLPLLGLGLVPLLLKIKKKKKNNNKPGPVILGGGNAVGAGGGLGVLLGAGGGGAVGGGKPGGAAGGEYDEYEQYEPSAEGPYGNAYPAIDDRVEIVRQRRSVQSASAFPAMSVDQVDRLTSTVFAALDSQECLQRVLCEAGALSRTFSTAANVAKSVEKYVPESLRSSFNIFNSNEKCDKYVCGHLKTDH